MQSKVLKTNKTTNNNKKNLNNEKLLFAVHVKSRTPDPPSPKLVMQAVVLSSCWLDLVREIKAAQITCQQLRRFSHPRQQVCWAQAWGATPQGLHLRGWRTNLTKWQVGEFLNGKWLNHLTLEFPSVNSWLEFSQFPHHRLRFLRKKDSDTVSFSFTMFWSGPWADYPRALLEKSDYSLLATQGGLYFATYRGRFPRAPISQTGAFQVAPRYLNRQK